MRILDESFRIEGKQIYLRPITLEDTDEILKIRNSENVVSHFFYRKPISREEHINWVENKVKKGDVIQFTVCLKNTDEIVGSVYMQHYVPKDNAIESGIFMGDNAPKGQGIGTEAYNLMNKNVAFDMLKLDKIYTRVIADNIPSVKLHLKCGFTQSGVFMQKTIPDGEELKTIEFVMYRNEG